MCIASALVFERIYISCLRLFANDKDTSSDTTPTLYEADPSKQKKGATPVPHLFYLSFISHFAPMLFGNPLR